MKRIMTILCCLVFMITAFSGCNKDNNAAPSSDNGRYEIQQINNDFCLIIDEETVEMLEDLITSAMQQATKDATKKMQDKMKGIVPAGINIPGLF